MLKIYFLTIDKKYMHYETIEAPFNLIFIIYNIFIKKGLYKTDQFNVLRKRVENLHEYNHWSKLNTFSQWLGLIIKILFNFFLKFLKGNEKHYVVIEKLDELHSKCLENCLYNYSIFTMETTDYDQESDQLKNRVINMYESFRESTQRQNKIFVEDLKETSLSRYNSILNEVTLLNFSQF